MKSVWTIALALPLAAGCASIDSRTQAPDAAGSGCVDSARIHWRNGDIELAERDALAAEDSPQRDRVQFDCAFAKGEYERALEIYPALARSRAGRASLGAAIEANIHLGRFTEAADLARVRKAAKWKRELLDELAAAPLRARLEGTTIVPFETVPLMGVDFSDSLPGVAVELDGERIVAHFDSGAAFLVMSPEKARSLGIELRGGERAFASLSWERMSYGIAKSLRIGDALLENVPVAAAPQLKGDLDRVYFGTCILERFFATVDYPSRRLILSPRDDEKLKAEHFAMLAGDRSEIPFYLWADHFMFARGSVGDERDLNFFIDSGLFFLMADDSGAIKRGSLLAAPADCRRWGMNPADAKKGYFECRSPISLGSSTREEGAYIVAGPMDVIEENFGGVRIDALLSNGFLGNYSWTIDFDRRVFCLSRPN
jgi:hypothetical protein